VFFVLSKIFGFFAQPSNLIVLCTAFGVALLFTPAQRAGQWIATCGVLLLLLAGLSPLGNALILLLEERFPPWDGAHGPPDGIVVLGGAVGPEISAARGTAALNEAAERLTAVAALARQFPAARIIYSGGNASVLRTGGIEADYALALLESLGVPRERIEVERRSRNTVENAIYSKALADPKPSERWLLVTSAYHMPRAVGAFRRAGFSVEPYPVDWRTAGRVDLVVPFNDISAGLRRTDTAAREWMGLLVYRLTGRVSELFPGPASD
jgi:uncharacterized SAM-binding protein YcdF (DUF218 family)